MAEEPDPRDDSELLRVTGVLLEAAEQTKDPRISQLAADAIKLIDSLSIVTLIRELAVAKAATKPSNPFIDRGGRNNQQQIQDLIQQIATQVKQ